MLLFPMADPHRRRSRMRSEKQPKQRRKISPARSKKSSRRPKATSARPARKGAKKLNNEVHAKILALGSGFPERVVTNFDLEKLVDTSDEWIRQRSGIVNRRWLSEGEQNSDLGARAATAALEKAGLDPLDRKS